MTKINGSQNISLMKNERATTLFSFSFFNIIDILFPVYVSIKLNYFFLSFIGLPNFSLHCFKIPDSCFSHSVKFC